MNAKTAPDEFRIGCIQHDCAECQRCIASQTSGADALTFAELRAANLVRCTQFRDGKGNLCHPKGVEDWLISQWTNAMAGETGEACNVAKKIDRGDFTLDEGGRKKLADELADAVTYACLAAARAGIDLGAAVRAKFNEVRPMKRIAFALAMFAGAALAEPMPPDARAVPASFHASATVAQMYGQYREGHFPVPQMIITATEYRGFQFQSFRPFYYEALVPLNELPFQVRCCILSPDQYVQGNTNGPVRVIHVFLDPNPDDGRNVRTGFIGPIESWVPYGDNEIISITAPFIGRRAFKVP